MVKEGTAPATLGAASATLALVTPQQTRHTATPTARPCAARRPTSGTSAAASAALGTACPAVNRRNEAEIYLTVATLKDPFLVVLTNKV